MLDLMIYITQDMFLHFIPNYFIWNNGCLWLVSSPTLQISVHPYYKLIGMKNENKKDVVD